ncbi:MAG: beta-propeller fold lactonase family protein [Acidobacteriaceae bacterium]
MKLSFIGRWSLALFASLVLALGTTSCTVGTIGYMWVIGQEYNMIGGFKIDQYSGNLTAIETSPWGTEGSVPVFILVRSGGRYVYVINQGVNGGPQGRGAGQTISEYSVGGDGLLTYQQSYQSEGYVSKWAQMDSSGNYLMVLDEYAPGLGQGGLYDGPNTDGNGSITVFQSDPNTGRLTLVTNLQTQVNAVNLPFWEVGASPVMSKSLGSCLYTVNAGTNASGQQTVTPFEINSSSGQLLYTTTGNIAINETTPGSPTNITSINGAGSFIFLTDAANNVLYGYESTSSCNLTALNGGTTSLANFFPNTSDPDYSLIDSTNSYIYVANFSSASTLPQIAYSSLSAMTINKTNQELQPIVGSPYTVGSGPTCIVEDPSNQYIYTSNYTAGTVTGFELNPDSGELSDLTKGSTFPTVGKASCMAISGTID